MKTKRFWKPSVLLLVVFWIGACASTNSDLKNQGETEKLLGEAYFIEKNYTSALRSFLKAEKSSPKDPFLQNDLGLVYLEKSRLDLAEKHFQKAIDIKPDYVIAINNLGNVYLRGKSWEQAIRLYEDLIESPNFDLYETPYDVYNNLALAYFGKSDFSSAIRYYREALDIAPRYARALAGLGLSYRETGKMDAAIENLELAASIVPNAPDIQFWLGETLFLAGDRQGALAYFQQVIKMAPDTPLAGKAKNEITKLQAIQ